MGKIYQFECETCGYRAAVAGGLADGRDLKIRTIVCLECRAIYDCVVALRADAAAEPKGRFGKGSQAAAPSLAQALARLPVPPRKPRRWQTFELSCPSDPTHHVQPWTTPARCPRCKTYMERGAMPYRIWE